MFGIKKYIFPLFFFISLQLIAQESADITIMVGPSVKTEQLNVLSSSKNTLAAQSVKQNESVNFLGWLRDNLLGNSFCFPNFTAVSLNNETNKELGIPPDSMAAVGPTQIVAFCNNAVISFDKKGMPDGVLNQTSNDFFAPFFNHVGFSYNTINPRIKYDPFHQRWIVVMNTIPNPNNPHLQYLLVAYTTDAKNGIITKDTNWNQIGFFFISNIFQFDSITLGIDHIAAYVGFNVLLHSNNQYVVSEILLLNQTFFEQDSFPFKALIVSGSDGELLNPVGADNFNPDSTVGFVIGVPQGSTNTLNMRVINNPEDLDRVNISDIISLNVQKIGKTLDVPNKGGDRLLDGLDYQALNSAVIQKVGKQDLLYTTHGIGVNNEGEVSDNNNNSRNGCRWYEIDVTIPMNPSITQTGTLFDRTFRNVSNARYYWTPSIMSNGSTVAIGCSTAAKNEYIDAAYVIRKNEDEPGTLREPILYTQSNSAYNPPKDPLTPRKWGKYSTMCLDPCNNSIWAVQEFCDETNSFGVQIAQVVPGIMPPKIQCICPREVERDSEGIILTIVGEQDSGEFIVSSNCGNTLKIDIEDVFVDQNSIVVLTLTTLQVSISTIGSKPGKKKVTITNPDGQKVCSCIKITR